VLAGKIKTAKKNVLKFLQRFWRKIEKAFGEDNWALRIGDVAGSTDMHNISKADLIKLIIDEIEYEVKRIATKETKKVNVRTTMKCDECDGEVKPKIDFYKQDKDGKDWEQFKKIEKQMKKEGIDWEPKGYNCIKCGKCWDELFQQEQIRMGWL